MMAEQELRVSIPHDIHAATVTESSISLSLSDGSSVEHVSESSLQSAVSSNCSNNNTIGNVYNNANGNGNVNGNSNSNSNSSVDSIHLTNADTNSHNSSTRSGSGSGSNFQMLTLDARRYSDFTVPTSNATPPLTATEAAALALKLKVEAAAEAAAAAQEATWIHPGSSSSSTDSQHQHEKPKRSIFGNVVQKKYSVDDSGTAGAAWNDHPSEPKEEQPHHQAHHGDSLYQTVHNPNAAAAPANTATTPTSSATSTPQRENHPGMNRYAGSGSDISFGADMDRTSSNSLSESPPRGQLVMMDDSLMSPLTPNTTRKQHHQQQKRQAQAQQQQQNGLHRASSASGLDNDKGDKDNGGGVKNHNPNHNHNLTKQPPRPQRAHEHIHAQSLLLGLAFAAVWTPSNLMAPNLTEIATDFGFDDSQRDLYLGSYCALATGVLSFPIGAGIGILTDIVSRQRLFCVTVAGGALSSLATGCCTRYWQLFLARLLTGGFMSGSVPVAFSFLGDLFATEERNAASSGLTAMMGLGIILGQVYAGVVGSTAGWTHAFFVSGIGTMILAVLCLFLVQEPVRGGKEKALQDMLKAGTRYERKLTWKRFWHTVAHNESNMILLWQGFFSSLPWGIIFVFLNDYLSQERNFSVPDATFLVFLFGIGCAVGGILGGYLGQKVQALNRSYLPLFMAATTLLGIFPFLGLLNSNFTNAHGPHAIFFAVSGGLTASLPAVNVRPVLINVNPPETRGASLTAANLLINLGRGFGPSCITLMGTIWHVDRQFAFNVTLILFWTISSFQLLFLAKTLPRDQDKMEAELTAYAEQALARLQPADDDYEGDSVVSIEERMTSFDGAAARESLLFMREGFKELREVSGKLKSFPCGGRAEDSSSEDDEASDASGLRQRREIWLRQQMQAHNESSEEVGLGGQQRPSETTRLIV